MNTVDIVLAEDLAAQEREARRKTLPRFPLYRAGTRELMPPDWLVDGFLERGAFGLIFGEPETGKSFIALDLAASIATGASWHGRNARSGPVVYLAGEGHAGIDRRLEAWRIAHRFDSLAPFPLYLSEIPASLADAELMERLDVALADVAAENGAPALLVLDTWARNLGADENSTPDVAQAIAALDRLRAPYRCASLVVHHPGIGDKTRSRGNGALRGALDVEYRATRGADDLIRLECLKSKETERPGSLAFRLRSVDLGIVDEHGRPVLSAVVEPEAYQPESGAADAPGSGLAPADKRLLTLLMDNKGGLTAVQLATMTGQTEGAVRAGLSRLAAVKYATKGADGKWNDS